MDRTDYQILNILQKDCRATLKSIGDPDLLVLFTGTVSHKMVRSTLRETRGKAVKIVRCHTSSASALRNILQTHTGKEEAPCRMP